MDIIAYKYENFVEFIQLNYLDNIQAAMGEYIRDYELNEKNSEGDYRFNAYNINSITVKFIKFTKSQIDKVEFEVCLKSDYELAETDDDSILVSISKSEFFLYKMKGSFKEGFKGRKKDELQLLEKEPVEVLSNGLVPIIPTDKMDEYATIFLKEFCKEALETPTKLNLSKMLKEKSIEYYYAPIDDSVFGVTYFAEDDVDVYDDRLNIEKKHIKPGTILINIEKHFDRNEGAFRNTVIHECVHWFFHRNYFELRQCLNSELNHVSCQKGYNHYECKDIEWMEWQARTLAPRILMPKKMALQKFNEITKEIDLMCEEQPMTITEKWEKALLMFKDFFGVSITSAKIRLKELGKTKIEGIKNYVDGEYLLPFSFKSSALEKNQTFIINSQSLSNLLTSNIFVRDNLRTEKLLYINKMLVVNNPKYVDNEKYELTEYALEHAHECCLIFNTKRYGIDANGELSLNCFMFSAGSNRKEIKEVNQEHATRVIRSAIDGASHFERHKHLLPESFAQTLEYHCNKAKENKIIKSYEELAYESDITEKTIRSYRDGTTTPNRKSIIKLGLALKLSAPYIRDMLEKADNLMVANSADNTILFAIIYGFQRMGLERTYKELQKEKKGYILELSDTYLELHGLA